MTPLYESRQVGWWLLGMIVVMMVFIAVIDLTSTGDELPWWFYVMLPVVIIPFSIMTVRVTRRDVQVRFLLPIMRKTVPIEEIRTCEPYRIEGLQRLQCQVKPFQGRFQLTGGSGVIILREKGIPIHISDPNPAKLVRAVERARGRRDKE